MARIGLGRVLAGQALAGRADTGHVQEALAHLEAGLQSDPFVTDAWQLAAEMRLLAGDTGVARAYLAERLTMLDALMPPTERLAMSAALPELEEARRALLELLRRTDPRAISEECQFALPTGSER
jgi:hypothetical protein